MNIFKKLINKLLLRLAKKLRAVVIKEKQNIQKKMASLTIGKHTYGIENINIDRYKGSDSAITIGKYCSIATNVTVITGGIHPIDRVSTFPFKAKFNLEGKFTNGMPYSNGDIHIGNDVWIGTGVTILSGVKIEDGAVIASNATVTKDIPAYAIAGGVPCKVLKYRFDKEIIDKLLELKWWDWKEGRIIENVNFLTNLADNKTIDKIIND